MEDKNIIYKNVNKNLTPIDTSAEDFAFEADAAKARRQTEERNSVMNRPIDTSAKDFAFQADAAKARRQAEERNSVMNRPIDTSAKDFALKAELEKARRILLEQQDMYQNTEEPAYKRK